MGTTSDHVEQHEIPTLLRGEPEGLKQAIEQCTWKRVGLHVLIIILGAGLFGAAVGSWRASQQALYTAIKFPMILLLTAAGNALLNGMLAPLLGLNISFRHSLLAILMSFTVAAAILGSFSPILYFLVWNSPPLGQRGPIDAYNFLLLIQVLAIAFAGVAANLHLWRLLRWWSGSQVIARNILVGWLAGNLLLGAQLSWNLRPFVGSPGLEVQFVRPNAFQGNFFEAVLYAVRNLAPK